MKENKAENCSEFFLPLFLQHKSEYMDYRQQEYHEELQKVQDRDFTHDWVSSSAFIFYLSVVCLVMFSLGSCYKLYTERYKNSQPKNVVIQESTRFVPQYK